MSLSREPRYYDASREPTYAEREDPGVRDGRARCRRTALRMCDFGSIDLGFDLGFRV